MERDNRNKPLCIKFKEFSNPQREDSKLSQYLCKKKGELNECADEIDWKKRAKYLGIREKNDKLIADHFVGMRWLEEGKCFLTVEPKIAKLDYISMYLECLKSDEIIKHLDRMFDVYPEEQFIPMDEDDWPKISPLFVITFLKRLFDLTKRHTRWNYITVTENLRSRIKGKIRVPDTIKRNHSKFKIESTVCTFQFFGIDCLENRILKLAFEKSRRYLIHKNLHKKSPIDIWLNYCNVVFENVPLVPITYQDFQRVHYSNFYKEYKELHKLAKLIFKQFGYSLQQNFEKYTFLTPPFWIDMNELFERYCEGNLRKKYKLWAGYDENNLGDEFKVRPDFLIPERKIIIDCKYKQYWDWGKDDFRSDVYQVVSYSRHKDVKEKLGLTRDVDLCKGIYILYPCSSKDDGGVNEIDFEKIEDDIANAKKLKAFDVLLYKVKIGLPIVGKD